MATALKAVEKPQPKGLDLLRQPFPAHQISKLPKPYKKDSPKGKCNECGGYHGLPAVHLDYVGHAALTDRLLDTDPHWSWEPLALDDRGLPARDQNGGLWIRLTVCGVTRLGYGSADGKSGGDAIKELIGDALRNAAMRFGAALDLWHKGDLHADPEPEAGENVESAADTPRDEPAPREKLEGKHSSKTALANALRAYGFKVGAAASTRELDAIEAEYKDDLAQGERYLPKWMNGDPSQDSKGLKLLTHERRLFLELLDRMRESQTPKALSAWLGAYSEEIEGLSDANGREFEKALAEHEAGMKLLASQN
jgi:hypothetical protein